MSRTVTSADVLRRLHPGTAVCPSHIGGGVQTDMGVYGSAFNNACPDQTGEKFLVAGWFSFEQGHATAGDLLARDR